MKRLILGAGKAERMEGADHQDQFDFEGIDLVFNLNDEVWPIEDNTYDFIAANHVLEHLDDFLRFHNECWRILKPGGSLYISTPCAGLDVDLEFADPTHKRCYRPHSWINYLTLEGIHNFGYTDKAWCSMHIEVKPDKCLYVHAMPLKWPQ